MNYTAQSECLSTKRAKNTPQRDNIGKWVTQGDERSGPRRLIDIKEASGYLGLQVDTLYRMVSERRIPYIKVGRRTKFDVQLLDTWLEKHTVMPLPPKTT